MFQSAWWVGLPVREIEAKKIYQGDLNGRFAYYRCATFLREGAHLELKITAGSRYRLWVNGQPVLSGPCKGDLHRWYYDTVDVSHLLKPGKNVLAVQVLFVDHYSTVYQEQQRSPIFSVAAPGGTHRLVVEGTAVDPDGGTQSVTTGVADWRCFLDASYYLENQEHTIYLGSTCEQIRYDALPHRWKQPDFDDCRWGSPEKLESVIASDYMRGVGLLQRFPIRERPIAPLYETDCCFAHPGELEKEITVPAGTEKTFLLDAGAAVNCYPAFRFRGGKGSTVRITYFEKFTGPNAKNKADPRGDYSGITDTLHLNGEDVTFEPFWYRSFRFVAVTVTADAATVIQPPVYRKTGYPLAGVSSIRSSEKWVEEVYDICLRTLENCMMDTYMDCPYYEQNQFPMDTRLQALFCSAVSGDMGLTYKALEDLHCSISPDGLVHGRYPASYQQIISTFSLHYIFMLEETWQQTGDLAPLRRYLPDLDRILGYYDAHIDENGLVGRLGWWEFVDWQPKWSHCGGIPEALLHGPSAIINLMYALALEKSAVLWDAAGRPQLAAEYRQRKTAITRRVYELCWDGQRQMLREGPGFPQFTQHAQSWAVLTGLLQGEQAKLALLHALGDDDVLTCSFSTAYEWFRALEAAGLYPETRANMMRWADLPRQGNTTCPETPEDARSECHAWSALPIYEFLRVMGGVRMEKGQVIVTPPVGYLKDYSGEIWVPGGLAQFRFADGTYTVMLPQGTSGILRHPDGRELPLSGGRMYTCET